MSVNVSMTQWMEWIKSVEDKQERRKEQLLFDIAQAIVIQAKLICRGKFGRGIGKTARTRGRGGGLMNSISAVRVDAKETKVTAGGPGVPYARIHELGTVGQGGLLPTIVPKNVKWLTQPMQPKYVGFRAREFNLKFIPSKNRKDIAFLVEQEEIDKYKKKSKSKSVKKKSLKIAYLLRKKTDIPARPYLSPAVGMIMMKDKFNDRVKKVYGDNGKINFNFVSI